jgi:glycosyltransferase 2 family protein
MEDQPRKETTTSKTLKLLLKIVVTIACLWYVFSKIDFREVWSAAGSSKPGWLLAALVVYSLSKLVSSRRLNIYFRNIGIMIPESQNLKLYWLGMFYNLFLPGAITGDAYKVILLSKRHGIPYRKTAAAVLLDRFSGVLSLGLIIGILGQWVIKEKFLSIILITGALAAVPIAYLFIGKFFRDFLKDFWPTFFLGAVVQIAMLFTVYLLLLALNISSDQTSYIFIFLIAVLASVLPISVGGGLGVREFVIVEGAKYAGLEPHTALLLSLIFYIITVICSLAGSVFVFRDPLSPGYQPMKLPNENTTS